MVQEVVMWVQGFAGFWHSLLPTQLPPMLLIIVKGNVGRSIADCANRSECQIVTMACSLVTAFCVVISRHILMEGETETGLQKGYYIKLFRMLEVLLVSYLGFRGPGPSCNARNEHSKASRQYAFNGGSWYFLLSSGKGDAAFLCSPD